MLKKANLIKLLAALVALLALSACLHAKPTVTPTAAPGAAVTTQTAAPTANAESLPEELKSLLKARQDAVNGKNQKAYLATVLPSDAVLAKEETNLIRAAAGLGVSDYSLAATDIRKTSDGFTAALIQSYMLANDKHKCEYTAAFKTEGGKLYYCGPAFDEKQNDLVRVYYTGADEGLADELLALETDILGRMRQHLGFTPNGPISVKLFEDQAVFLQSVKLDLPAWVGGWHEYGESIKSFTGAYGNSAGPYREMLNHESTHRMVSELSNDNAAYWLQEGLAGVYENWLDSPGNEYLTSDEAAAAITPFVENEKIDLEKLGMDDLGAVSLYYESSRVYAAFLLEKFGWEKMSQTLEYMKKYEMIPVTAAEKIAETNSRTDEAVKEIYKFNEGKELQAAFDKWLAEKKK